MSKMRILEEGPDPSGLGRLLEVSASDAHPALNAPKASIPAVRVRRPDDVAFAKRRGGRKVQNRVVPGQEADSAGKARESLKEKLEKAQFDGREGDSKADVCQEILAEGYVQSFVDFFYLTHQSELQEGPSTDAKENAELKMDDLLFLKKTLIAAEEARRQGSTDSVFASYEALAQFYQARKDPRTGIYFYEKCLEICKLTGDPKGEIRANQRLGTAYFASGDLASARQFHERSLALAHAQAEDGEMQRACASLVSIYRQAAQQLDKDGNFDACIGEYEKCREAAKKAENVADEGEACYNLGRTHFRNGNARDALSHLLTYETISTDLGDLEGQGRAQAALANAYESIGNHDKCVECLQKFMDIATRSEDLNSQAEACRALGMIHHRRREFRAAVELFEKNFTICRSMSSSGLGSSAQLDSARILVGLARGNARLKQHIFEINSDLSALLDWKIAKVGGPRL